MRHILIIFLLAFSLTSYGQSTPPPASRGSDNATQVDRFVTALKRLGIPTAATDTLSPALQLTDAENSAKLLFNTTSQKLRLYIPGSGWRDATPIDLTNYYTKSQVDSLLSELPTGASNLSISSRTDTTVIVGNSNGTGVTLPPVNTSQAGVMPASDKTKLDGIESGAQVNTVTDVAGKTGAVDIDKTDVGLDQVDNTSDEDKPVSNATQDSLNLKENAFSKGNLVQGTNVTLSGTLTNRLVGSGNVTINASQPAAQTLTSYFYQIGISGGNSVNVQGVTTHNKPVSTTAPIGPGLYPFTNTTGSEGYPGAAGGGIYYNRGGASSQLGAFHIWKASVTNENVLYYNSGTGASTMSSYEAIASREHVAATYLPLSQKGANNGVATLGVDGKVPSAQLPSGGMQYQGTWNASTNTPTLSDGTGTDGYYYRVSTSGTQDLGSGSISFTAGDDVIHNGSIWQRVPSSASVASVNGYTGAVVLDATDVGAVPDTRTINGKVLSSDVTLDADDVGAIDTETDPTVESHIKDITTGDIADWDGKLDSTRRVTDFSSPDNLNVPSVQAVVNYVSSQIPGAQTLSLTGAAGTIGISGGNNVGLTSLNRVVLSNAFPSVTGLGFHHLVNSTSSTGWPAEGGASIRVNRADLTSTTGGSFEIWKSVSNDGKLRLNLGTTGTSWTGWQTFATEEFTAATYVPLARTITVNGTPYALSSNISFTTPNTTYTAGTGLTLTGTVFTPTFGTTSGTVAQGNHTHDTATVSVSGFMTPYDKARIAAFSPDGLATLGTSQTFTAAKTFNGASANLTMYEGSGGASPFIYFRNTNNSINGDTTSMYYNSGTGGHVIRVNGTARLTTTSSGITVNGAISGTGSGITGLNGSNISTGTIPFARLPVGTSSSTVAVGDHTHAFSAITSTPTTLSGYGITDAVSSSTTRTANTVYAGPTTGSAAAPTFRALVAADLPATAVLTNKATQVMSVQLAFNGSGANILMNERATGLSPYIYFRNTDNSISGTNTSMVLAAGSGGYTFAVSGTNRLTVNSTGISVTGSISGSGSGITGLNASNLADGTVPAVRLPAATTSTQGALSAADKTKLDGYGNPAPYDLAAGTTITWANGVTQYTSLSANRSYTVTMSAGNALDVQIKNTAGSTVTMTFSGADLPDGEDGTIPAGKRAVFSFKRFNGTDSAVVTKVIF